MTQGQRVARAAGSMMLAMLVSRILGFVREAVIGAKFGQNEITDSYIAAFALPDFLYFLLVGGAISTAFIPVFSSYVARQENEDSWRVASSIVNAMVIMLVIGIVLGEIFTPYLIPLVAFDFEGETLERTIFLTRLMFPSVLFTGLAGLSMGILNSHQHFLMPALGSILYNLVIIVVGWLFADQLGIAAFSIGVVFGALTNFAVQLPALSRAGFRYRLTLDLRHPGVKRIGALMIPALIGLSIGQVQDIINQNLASSLEAGSITALRFANRLMQLPLGVFAIAISVAVFPTLTRCAANKEWEEFRKHLSLGLRSVVFITLPAAVGMMILRVPLVQVLFEHGKFDRAATLSTASVLFYFLIGLVAQGANQLLPRVFYAVQKPQIVVRISAISLVFNTLISLVVLNWLGAEGLALAFSISAFLTTGLFLLMARRALRKMGGRRMVRSCLQTLFAAVLMGAVLQSVVYLVSTFLPVEQEWMQYGAMVIYVAVGALVYGAVTIAMGMEEARFVQQAFLGRFKRR
ncbi:murein biosynthesis integral membrane protein MurJ [Heliophilum fasciatum]|uniref:Probable lipid II flippase MurJ n=1 Tax=Heliophilum fasciatum TaxID=35700 RepID=A0A4R2RMF9_9FIRM|nr:murein biosynthesis integral membrane protein MurJ [Heliophilum fasciatum]MCW2278124.1 putative peptidoglycan lipid II flippase [Heliophilum fasciatum]TCP64194.1 putative peptidoglycan lipid II flippase [Heliophilum fasciatum]